MHLFTVYIDSEYQHRLKRSQNKNKKWRGVDVTLFTGSKTTCFAVEKIKHDKI